MTRILPARALKKTFEDDGVYMALNAFQVSSRRNPNGPAHARVNKIFEQNERAIGDVFVFSRALAHI